MGLLVAMANGCLLLCFACRCYPRDSSPRVSQHRKALWHFPQQLCQRLGEPCVTCPATDRLQEAPSFPELPWLPGTPVLVQAGARSPRRVFSHPNNAPGSKSHSTGPAVGGVSCLAPFPSHRARLCAFPAVRTLCGLGGTSGRLTERSGQSTKALDAVPRPECQGRGDLASHLFFLGTKHAFKSRSRFAGEGWELLGAGRLPQF